MNIAIWMNNATKIYPRDGQTVVHEPYMTSGKFRKMNESRMK